MLRDHKGLQHQRVAADIVARIGDRGAGLRGLVINPDANLIDAGWQWLSERDPIGVTDDLAALPTVECMVAIHWPVIAIGIISGNAWPLMVTACTTSGRLPASTFMAGTASAASSYIRPGMRRFAAPITKK
jgi:hypothetical protein